MIPKEKQISYEEFLDLQKGEQRFEYINGEIYMLSSPSVDHQRALLNIASIFNRYFKGKKCEPFIAPFDLLLKNEKDLYPHHVQPDIMVICDVNGLEESRYVGVPDLIIEIVSPSNTAYDRITKFNLYMKYGVKEYWLINPKFRSIEINVLTEEGIYEQIGIYKDQDVMSSYYFPDMVMILNDLF